MPLENGWVEYKRLVLQQLESLTAEVKDLKEEVTCLRVEVGQLKTRASMWGGLAGVAASVVIGLVLKFL